MQVNKVKGVKKGIRCPKLPFKTEDLFMFLNFKTMKIRTSFFVFTHTNVNKLKLKIHFQTQLLILVLVKNF